MHATSSLQLWHWHGSCPSHAGGNGATVLLRRPSPLPNPQMGCGRAAAPQPTLFEPAVAWQALQRSPAVFFSPTFQPERLDGFLQAVRLTMAPRQGSPRRKHVSCTDCKHIIHVSVMRYTLGWVCILPRHVHRQTHVYVVHTKLPTHMCTPAQTHTNTHAHALNG